MKKQWLIFRILIILFGITMAAPIWGQSLTIEIKRVTPRVTMKVIQPTIDNFIKLCNMTDIQFINAMKANGYTSVDETANPIGYWNVNIDNLNAHAYNTFYRNILTEVTEFLVKKENIYPSSSMVDFMISLKPYFYKHESTIFFDQPSDIFKIVRNGITYGIIVTDLEDYYNVIIRKFAK